MLRNLLVCSFFSAFLFSAHAAPVLFDITDPAVRQELIKIARDPKSPVDLRVKAIEALAQAARFSDTTPHLRNLLEGREEARIRAAAVTALADAAGFQDIRFRLRSLIDAQPESVLLRIAAAKSLSVYLVTDEAGQFLLFKTGRDKTQPVDLRLAALHAVQGTVQVGHNADMLEYVFLDKEEPFAVRAQAARSLAGRLNKDSDLLGVFLKAAPHNDLDPALRIAVLEALSAALNAGNTRDVLLKVARDEQASMEARSAALRSLEGPPECVLPSPDPRWWMRPTCR